MRPARVAARLRREAANVHLRLWFAHVLGNALPPDAFARLRAGIFRMAGTSIGTGTVLGGRLTISGGSRPQGRLVIGERCFINDDARFDVSAPITIGDAVYFGHAVTVITSSHEIGDAWCRARDVVTRPVTIGAGSWIGARATILPGATIGRGVVVAAGAVVTGHVEDNHLVGGVPARTIRVLPETASEG